MKLLFTLSLFVIFFSCKQVNNKVASDLAEKTISKKITESDISKLKYTDFVLDTKTEKTIENWQEYDQLEEVITTIKKGDLSFFNQNKTVIKELLTGLKGKIPVEVNTPSVLARLTVLETKLYKLESVSNLSTTTKAELSETIKEFLVSFSNLNLQMNKKLEIDANTVLKP